MSRVHVYPIPSMASECYLFNLMGVPLLTNLKSLKEVKNQSSSRAIMMIHKWSLIKKRKRFLNRHQ